MLTLAILLQTTGPNDDVVVVGKRSCDLSIAGKALRDEALDLHAAEWRAGRRVSIIVPAALRTKCLAKVMFRLQDRGVTQAEFVDAF